MSGKNIALSRVKTKGGGGHHPWLMLTLITPPLMLASKLQSNSL